jgi:PadR family transcriptional regulator, regulatory protein PadR
MTSPDLTPSSAIASCRPCAPGAGHALSRLEPWLLLLLAENPAHGYELLERLSELPDAPSADRGHMYRTLRRLESQGLVTSEWETPQAGPARHTYTLNADGLQALDAWTGHIRAARARLDAFLARRESLRAAALASRPPSSESGRARS